MVTSVKLREVLCWRLVRFDALFQESYGMLISIWDIAARRFPREPVFYTLAQLLKTKNMNKK